MASSTHRRAGQPGATMGRADHENSDESDAEVDEADYSVYECPGLAPTGDIEVANPMFANQHEQSPTKKQ